MAQRVTLENVRLALNVKVQGNDSTYVDSKLQIYVNMAFPMVDEIETEDTANELSSTILTQIELMLSCHFISMTVNRQQHTIAKQGVATTFQGKLDSVDFTQTTYGQLAILLDTTGTLASKQTGMDYTGIVAID